MKRYRTLFAVLLTILSLAFIVFVAIMQKNFTNPTFADLPLAQTGSETTEDDEEQNDDSDSVAGAAGSVVNDSTDGEAEEEDKSEETDTAYSTRTVLAETLNVRSGPGTDYELVGLLIEGQVVEVEDIGDEWVKVITDEFAGYVNENYLSEE